MNPFSNEMIPVFNPNKPPQLGSVFQIEHDGFIGEVIGYYTTREGKQGVVMQQLNTRVVHVYGTKWIK